MEQAESAGESYPLGPTLTPEGANFSIYSRNASGVDLLFFDSDDSALPTRTFRLDPYLNRTYHYWHISVPGARPGQIYAYRIHGPFCPSLGLRFDPTKILLDPYARRVVVPKNYSRDAACDPGDNTACAMKNMLVDLQPYNWENDRPLRTPSTRTIIYEMHVAGFTRNPNSGVIGEKRGTYAGLIDKIPYLRELGITAVELLPVFQFDAQDCPRGVVNYWGYAPVSFFAPHQSYSSNQCGSGPLDEFRDMVKALHRAGIEVILDVVYNHTAEGGASGPTFGFKGIDNPTYYILEEDRSRYANFTGTGNTLNGNHCVVTRMILDSLRYWVGEMHVDGFRFDLASILARDSSGNAMPTPPVLWDIESDPMLAGTKLIAEAWDAAGLYQVGSFIGDAWKEWNGRFRDDLRSFFRGEPGAVRRFADRLVGSPEVYGHEAREAEQSVNFVTCHDGFTLNDLVSYDKKHNDENGEYNRDGGDDNRSWNCGVEGPTEDTGIEKLRNRQAKNFLAATIVSLGIPMIYMGDEIRRTQRGNNNAYCLDNENNWMDWSLLDKHRDVQRFVKLLAQRRVLRDLGPELSHKPLNDVIRSAVKCWHGVRLNQPDWSENSRSIALSAEVEGEGVSFYLILNAYWDSLTFEVPEIDFVSHGPWRRWIDTTLEAPDDIVDWQCAPPVLGDLYHAGPRSTVVLIASKTCIGSPAAPSAG
ncbi:MAG TPA: glycogen debranching protein GlgX [Terracidiphilus sp.]|nr:glycogen debranching protein GlgX [Terracidiphilus sp.]